MDVLVVADDGDMRDALCAVLEDEGYRVRAAADGPAALAYLRRTRKPLVVLVDEPLSPLTSIQEVEAYLQAPAPTRQWEFILLRASPAEATPRSVPLVEKPFHLETLLEAVAQAVARLEGQ
jgi:CheY-like chemotaxis protein